MEITKATATAMPHEAAIPKVWKKRTRKMGRGILSSEKIVFFDNTKSALLLLIHTKSITCENVEKRTMRTKAVEKIAFSLMKPMAGAQISRPATKIAARARAKIPLKVRQELIIS